MHYGLFHHRAATRPANICSPFFNGRPATDSAILLHSLFHRSIDDPVDPLITNHHTIRSLSDELEVFGKLHRLVFGASVRLTTQSLSTDVQRRPGFSPASEHLSIFLGAYPEKIPLAGTDAHRGADVAVLSNRLRVGGAVSLRASDTDV